MSSQVIWSLSMCAPFIIYVVINAKNQIPCAGERTVDGFRATDQIESVLGSFMMDWKPFCDSTCTRSAATTTTRPTRFAATMSIVLRVMRSGCSPCLILINRSTMSSWRWYSSESVSYCCKSSMAARSCESKGFSFFLKRSRNNMSPVCGSLYYMFYLRMTLKVTESTCSNSSGLSLSSIEYNVLPF